MTESLKPKSLELDVKPVNGVSEPALEEGKMPTVTSDSGEEVIIIIAYRLFLF